MFFDLNNLHFKLKNYLDMVFFKRYVQSFIESD